MVRYRYPLVAGILGVVYGSALFLVARTDAISPVGDTGGVALGLIQLVALFAPALALFMQALLRYSADKESRPGLSGGVGGMAPDEFRIFVIFAGCLSSFFLINGLLILLITLDLPRAIDLAVIPIAIGLMLVPILLGMTFWYEFQDMRTRVH